MPTAAIETPAQEPPVQEVQLKVTGMHCASCAATVQRAIEADPQVRSASVSVTAGMATVLGQSLEPQRLVQAVRDRGYDAVPITAPAAPAELRSEIELRQRRQESLWRFRAIVGLGLWAPMGLLHWFAPDSWDGWVPWVLLAGATVVLATAGAGFYRSAIAAALRRTTNMDTLIAIGATTAYVFSVVVFIMQLAGSSIEQPLYFIEAAALLGIISLGHWLEAHASAKAGSAVRELLELQPEQAELIDEHGQTREIASADVQPGDRMLIRPGSRVPVDGLVVDGSSDVDESVVTGESMPVTRSPGDSVVAGSVNTTGRLIVEATVDGHHTTIARIAELVQRAQSSKAGIQRLADRVCAVFVPAVLLIAVATVAGWGLLALISSDTSSFAKGIIAAVTVLIISCPCALGLATPMAVTVGTGAASRHGILIKSAETIERAARSKLVIFDKTGTLTTGRPTTQGVTVEDRSFTEDELLRLAAAVEAPSEHPIARAIVRTPGFSHDRRRYQRCRGLGGSRPRHRPCLRHDHRDRVGRRRDPRRARHGGARNHQSGPPNPRHHQAEPLLRVPVQHRCDPSRCLRPVRPLRPAHRGGSHGCQRRHGHRQRSTPQAATAPRFGPSALADGDASPFGCVQQSEDARQPATEGLSAG